MNRLKMKAGFTLVELLVVMLIVAILSVSLLPMFKESICRAQYTADAVSVIGTLRHKIALYQYEHGKLPLNPAEKLVSSWNYKDNDREAFKHATYSIDNDPTTPGYDDNEAMEDTGRDDTDTATQNKIIWHSTVLDISYDDLKGRRSLPIDFVYYSIPIYDAGGNVSKTDSAYVIGCFGSGEGLQAGTGYAVCEINLVSKEKKYIGTFERYKAQKDEDSIPFLYFKSTPSNDGEPPADYVYCPDKLEGDETDDGADKRPNIITTLEKNGWKFSS